MQDTIKRENIEFALVLLLAVLAFGYVAWNTWKKPTGGITYDCRLAEISPDFPPEVRNQCRKLSLERFNNETKRENK